MRPTRAAVALICLGLVATACSRSDEPEGASSTSASTARTARTADFGTVSDVCRPGDAGGATAPGVTRDAIRVGTLSDTGFSGRPGLNQELFDTAAVFAAWCNAAGGINGRRIVVNERDAALTNVRARIVEACREDFFLVGGGVVFDNIGIKDRLECMLPAIPGYLVTPEARDSELFVHPVPSPPGAVGVGDYRWLGREFPESTKHVGVLTGDLQTTVKVADDDRTFVESLGWKVVYGDKYAVAGAVSWSPYVQALKDRGVRGLIWVGEPENLAKLLLAMADAGYSVDWIRAAANHVDERLIDLGGAALENTYVSSGTVPFEEADQNPALQQYLDLFAEYAPDAKTRALLGVQAWSAWLLFAQAARDCGAELTRRCVYDNAKEVHEWTGGGLHAPTDPGANRGSSCYLLLRATPDGFERVDIDPNDGIYRCSPDNTFFVKEGSDVGTTLADVDRSLDDL